MPCESCAVQFSVFKRKRVCPECDRYYCSSCLRRGGGLMCAPCRVLSSRPLGRAALAHLKVRDLQCFLHRQNVSTRGCVEKEDLINLAIAHVNSSAYRRRPSARCGEFASAFSSLRGFTSNINVLFNSAFDLGTPAARAPTPANPLPNRANGYHSSYYAASSPTTTSSIPSTSGHTARTTTLHSGLRAERGAGASGDLPGAPARDRSPPEVLVSDASEVESVVGARIESADCFEIEDVEDAADWEFVNRPADPLPNDAGVLLADNTFVPESELSNRASSELDLHRSESSDTVADTASLKDEPFVSSNATPKRVQLDDLKTVMDLESLNAKQLKELLTLNRVDYRGCVERKELLERAKRLWKESTKSREDINSMTMEECCKICMDAPMECVLLECGHIAACTACSKRLSECPICRQYVVRVVRFFRS